MRRQLLLAVVLSAAASASGAASRVVEQEHAGLTTSMARALVLERIEMISRTGACRASFGRENIDLERLRTLAAQTRFFSAVGSEGALRFSDAVGKPASPDETLRELAGRLAADAFVLGYYDGGRYVRTRRVVLGRGYFEQPQENGALRPTTPEEKQSLLLHELLHIALNKDDDDLNRRELCPLRLLAFCPRIPAPTVTTTASGQ